MSCHKVNPTFVVPYGSVPHAFNFAQNVTVTAIPSIDLYSPLSWATMAHEVIHSALKRPNIENEFKCDFWATAITGPAYPISFVLSYGSITGKTRLRNNRNTTHPNFEDRIKLCTTVLQKFLGYTAEFIQEFVLDPCNDLCLFDSDETIDSLEYDPAYSKSVAVILDGYGEMDSKKKINEWGFTWKDFKDRDKVSGIGSRLLKGKQITGKNPVELINGIAYETVRQENFDGLSKDFLATVMTSIENSRSLSETHPSC
jgi:hypothetical protein